jgi:methionyl-tRNA formyltransferase
LHNKCHSELDSESKGLEIFFPQFKAKQHPVSLRLPPLTRGIIHLSFSKIPKINKYMSTIKTLKIAFVSSSDFCIPIANSLLALNGKTFNQLVNEHVIGLNKKEYLIGDANFTITQPHNYQDVKSLLGKVNNWPIEFKIVVSQPNNVIRGKSLPSPISQWAVKNNIELWKPENINNEGNELFNQLDLVVTASFGQLISQELLSKPKYGFINWHPSLLPKYRGPTPMQSTILNQDESYGLSWITMTKAMDAGKILLQLKNELKPEMDFEIIAGELGQLGGRTLAIAMLNQILNIGIEQNEDQVTICKKIEKEEQLIKIKDFTASDIMARQKAFIRFPGTVFEDGYFGCKVKVVDCSVLESSQLEGLEVLKYQSWNVVKVNKQQVVSMECKDQSLLQINKIKLNTGKLVDLSGYQFK